MHVTITLLLGFVGGLALGALHFAGLWHTLGRLPGARLPGLLLMASLVARMAVLLAGFYLMARWGGWPALAAGLIGVVAVRSWLLARIGPRPGAQGGSG